MGPPCLSNRGDGTDISRTDFQKERREGALGPALREVKDVGLIILPRDETRGPGSYSVRSHRGAGGGGGRTPRGGGPSRAPRWTESKWQSQGRPVRVGRRPEATWQGPGSEGDAGRGEGRPCPLLFLPRLWPPRFTHDPEGNAGCEPAFFPTICWQHEAKHQKGAPSPGRR